jgi:hypothetical protein
MMRSRQLAPLSWRHHAGENRGDRMIQLALAGYTLVLGERLPEEDEPDCAHAAFAERFDVAAATGQRHMSAPNELQVDVRHNTVWPEWPFLCVALRYHREGEGNPGVLLVPETGLLFIGAGERLVAYDLHSPRRLWEDQADMGFHTWQRHGDWVLMASELDFAAWDIRGVKRWSRCVEPPWSYRVEDDTVHLDVMGPRSSSPLVSWS